MNIYVETGTSAGMETLWELTQRPELHEVGSALHAYVDAVPAYARPRREERRE